MTLVAMVPAVLTDSAGEVHEGSLIKCVSTSSSCCKLEVSWTAELGHSKTWFCWPSQDGHQLINVICSRKCASRKTSDAVSR